MLTKVSIPNKYCTVNISNYIEKFKKSSSSVDKIQDNLEGQLLIKCSNGTIYTYNYNVNKFHTYNKIKIFFNDQCIIKQIDSFDQNNWIVGNKLRNYVIKKIHWINLHHDKINSILGIGGEYYLYWKFFPHVQNLIGISNHKTIVEDAKTNIPWSSNYLVDYDNLSTYPNIPQINLILMNLSKINVNVIKYLKKINFTTMIIILCDLSNSKLKLLSVNFIIKKIKYFKNFSGLLRVIEVVKRY